MSLRPFFSYYGGKWRAAPHYPAPRHSTIIEPFAGSAGYSLRYPDLEVILVEKYEKLAAIWEWLISASVDEVLGLPLVPDGVRVDSFDIPQAAQWLIGLNLQRGNTTPGQTRSAGAIMLRENGRKLSSWGVEMRARIAEQLDAIRHWRVIRGDYTAAPDLEADWMIDPPYQVAGKYYRHGAAGLDFPALGEWCRSRRGQVIVCEAAGADWLPFRPFRKLKSQQGYSNEVVYTQRVGQLSLLGPL